MTKKRKQLFRILFFKIIIIRKIKIYLLMMSSDKKMTILTIKNTSKNMDLLRVHIHESSIRFDEKVNDAINNLPELKSEVNELNYLWQNQKIDQQDILKIVLYLMGQYGNYLKDFYFTEDDLDENGCYVDGNEKNISGQPMSLQDEQNFFYEYFKDQKVLKKISKKAFEEEVQKENLAEEYVENYVFKGAKFYSGLLEEEKFISVWYFMIVEDKIKMAFEKVIK